MLSLFSVSLGALLSAQSVALVKPTQPSQPQPSGLSAYGGGRAIFEMSRL